MNYAQQQFIGCVNAARMARDNARINRRMARNWPTSAEEYESGARDAFGRARDYLRWARSFRSEANANG
jgi:hypothetical protein